MIPSKRTPHVPWLLVVALFHETLNKDRQPYRIAVGEPISARALPPTSAAAGGRRRSRKPAPSRSAP